MTILIFLISLLASDAYEYQHDDIGHKIGK